MKKHCLIDVSNLVHRAKHALFNKKNRPSVWGVEEETDQEKIGLILHTVFKSLKRSAEKFDTDHCVACFDSSSWRRDYYPEYKAQRREKRKTPDEKREHELVNQAIDSFRDFVRDYTNVTVLEAEGVEADDFISRWVQLHDDEEFSHVIVSGDSDFKQLVRPGVDLFMPLTNTLYTSDGVYFQDTRKPKPQDDTVYMYGEFWKIKRNKKTEQPETFDPDWELFEKCIRGDTSDNIRSAYPRVSTKRMKSAFYGDVKEWNNFINSYWGDDENRQSVRERYEFNKSLIDLTQQPEEIKQRMDQTILDALNKERKALVGAYFTKLCNTYRLNDLMNQADLISQVLSRSYD